MKKKTLVAPGLKKAADGFIASAFGHLSTVPPTELACQDGSLFSFLVIK